MPIRVFKNTNYEQYRTQIAKEAEEAALAEQASMRSTSAGRLPALLILIVITALFTVVAILGYFYLQGHFTTATPSAASPPEEIEIISLPSYVDDESQEVYQCANGTFSSTPLKNVPCEKVDKTEVLGKKNRFFGPKSDF